MNVGEIQQLKEKDNHVLAVTTRSQTSQGNHRNQAVEPIEESLSDVDEVFPFDFDDDMFSREEPKKRKRLTHTEKKENTLIQLGKDQKSEAHKLSEAQQ